MRWDNLFDELESQLEQHLGAEELDLRAEEERLRLGRLGLRDRLRAIATGDEPLALGLVDGSRITMDVETIGRDWLVGHMAGSSSRAAACVVPLASVSVVLPTASQLALSLAASSDAEGPGSAGAGLGLTSVLRDLCRRRCAVAITTRSGTLHGTIDRVGRDHLDLAQHDAGSVRRADAVTGICMLPLEEVVVLRL